MGEKFMELEGKSQCSQQPVTGPCTVTTESTPRLYALVLYDNSSIK
jgi:hypothetical protein